MSGGSQGACADILEADAGEAGSRKLGVWEPVNAVAGGRHDIPLSMGTAAPSLSRSGMPIAATVRCDFRPEHGIRRKGTVMSETVPQRSPDEDPFVDRI